MALKAAEVMAYFGEGAWKTGREAGGVWVGPCGGEVEVCERMLRGLGYTCGRK